MEAKTDEKKGNIVKDTNEEILENADRCGQKDNAVTDCQVERENVLLGPDPDSLDSRG